MSEFTARCAPPGIVDEDFDIAPGTAHAIEAQAHRCLIPDLHFDGQEAFLDDARRPHLFPRARNMVGGARTNRHPMAVSGKALRRRETDALGTAGDKRNFSRGGHESDDPTASVPPKLGRAVGGLEDRAYPLDPSLH